MQNQTDVRPPAACRFLIQAASCIVPAHSRSAWRGRWQGNLAAWWTLVQRGEITTRGSADMLHEWSGAFPDAFGTRVGKESLRDWARRPSFLLACTSMLLLLMAAISRGFTATRTMFHVASRIHFGRPGLDPAFESLVPYGIVFAFALATGIALIALRDQPLRGYGWRYHAFLGAKLMSVVVIGPVLWLETSAAVRLLLPKHEAFVVIPGLLFAAAFLFGFAFALGWCFTDQRRRCPNCLKRLAMPVTIGTWGSQLEPAITELLCDEGHGSLYLPETQSGERDRWASLDPSWQELFAGAQSSDGPSRQQH